MVDTPEQIAAGLTKAQRKALMTVGTSAQAYSSMWGRTRRSLFGLGLLECVKDGGTGEPIFRITETGLAVRKILETSHD